MSDGNKGIMIATINYHGSRGMMVAAMVGPLQFVDVSASFTLVAKKNTPLHIVL
jgi:hypothetical protein